MEKTLEDFQREHDRLWNWRDLWIRLSHRNNRSDTHNSKRSANAVFLASLLTRDEAVQRRARIADIKIGNLMREIDQWRERTGNDDWSR